MPKFANIMTSLKFSFFPGGKVKELNKELKSKHKEPFKFYMKLYK